MKYRFIMIGMILALSAGFASCSTDDPQPTPDNGQPMVPDKPDNGQDPNDNTAGIPDDNTPPEEPGNKDEGNHSAPDKPVSRRLIIRIGGISFSANLENHAASTAFKALLPMTVNMSELNGNEKYYNLPAPLPTASFNPGTIRAGDLMLYGSSCVVLFYETFRTSYSYTRLGHIDNPPGLAAALGSGRVNVTFELE